MIPPALGRIVLALAVCVSLLQTPVPIAHHHATMGSASQLQAHLALHHRFDTGCVEGFHWHFVLPCEMGHQGDEEESGKHTCPVAAECQLDSGDASLILMLADSAAVDGFVDKATAMQTPKSPLAIDSSVDRAASHLRPATRKCAVLCVIRC